MVLPHGHGLKPPLHQHHSFIRIEQSSNNRKSLRRRERPMVGGILQLTLEFSYSVKRARRVAPEAPDLCPFRCPLGPALGPLITADSGIVRRQVRQIVRSTSDLHGFLPGFGRSRSRLISVRSSRGRWVARECWPRASDSRSYSRCSRRYSRCSGTAGSGILPRQVRQIVQPSKECGREQRHIADSAVNCAVNCDRTS